MSLAILFHFLCAQHESDINISITRSLRLFCWITTLVVLFCKDGGFSINVKHHNSQYQQKYAYQLQQSDTARHITHTPLHTIIYANAKSPVFTEQYNQCGNSTE